MKLCNTVEEAADLAHAHLKKMEPRNVSHFWTHVASLITTRVDARKRADRFDAMTDHQRERLSGRLESIYDETMLLLDNNNGSSMTPSDPRPRPIDLANTALGLARIMKSVGRDRARGIPHLLRGVLLERHSRRGEEALQLIAESASRCERAFQARHLSYLAQAYAIAGIRAPELKDEEGSIITIYDFIEERSVPIFGKFTPRELVDLTWSFEKATGVPNTTADSFFESVADHVLSNVDLRGYRPGEISDLLATFARAGHSDPLLFDTISRHICTHGKLERYLPRELSDTLWAYARAGESSPRLFKKFADHIVATTMEKFRPRELSNMVWAFVKAAGGGEAADARLLKNVATHIVGRIDNLDYFEPRALSNTVAAYARAEFVYPPLFEKVGDHIVALDDLRAFGPGDCAEILWAFSKADVVARPRLMKKVRAHLNALGGLEALDETSLAKLSGDD